MRRQLNWLFDRNISKIRSKHTLLRLIGYVFKRRGDSNICRICLWQRQVRGDQWILHHDRSGRREKNPIPDTRITVANAWQPIPADGGKEGWTINRRDASVGHHAV